MNGINELKSNCMGYPGQGFSQEAPKASIAFQVLEMAEMLNKRAQALAMDMATKLEPVMLQSPQDSPNLGGVKATWPPLFNALRENFNGISDALDRIQGTLQDTEL